MNRPSSPSPPATINQMLARMPSRTPTAMTRIQPATPSQSHRTIRCKRSSRAYSRTSELSASFVLFFNLPFCFKFLYLHLLGGCLEAVVALNPITPLKMMPAVGFEPLTQTRQLFTHQRKISLIAHRHPICLLHTSMCNDTPLSENWIALMLDASISLSKLF